MDIPNDLLSKDSLSQFKTEEDVSNFIRPILLKISMAGNIQKTSCRYPMMMC